MLALRFHRIFSNHSNYRFELQNSGQFFVLLNLPFLFFIEYSNIFSLCLNFYSFYYPFFSSVYFIFSFFFFFCIFQFFYIYSNFTSFIIISLIFIFFLFFLISILFEIFEIIRFIINNDKLILPLLNMFSYFSCNAKCFKKHKEKKDKYPA